MLTVLYRYFPLKSRFSSLFIKRIMTEDTGDRTWGHLSTTEHFGRPSVSTDYIFVAKEELNVPLYKNCTQASHCMIFAKNNEKVFGVYGPRAAILMQMRFDGYLGFPGGLVDEGEDAIEGLNRELLEEVNLDLSKHRVVSDNYIVSHYSISKKICLHFYALELTLPEFQLVEQKALQCRDYGSEVLGTIRVPLYTMGDGYRGFPVFLNNMFIGNSSNQLIYTLKYLNIMSEADVNRALSARNLGCANTISKTKQES